MTDVPARVHYFDEQYLRTQDFADEQAYHLAAHRRHNVTQHSWGIVTGLELVADEGLVWIQPGVATDRFGRELVVAQRRPLPSGAFADKGADTLEVWLAYDRVPADASAGGRCEPGSFARWQEQPLVVLQVPDPAATDRRRPDGVAPIDLAHQPWQSSPDDPARYFPVYLGSITRGDPPVVDHAGRPYAGLVGEGVIAPSGRVALQIGTQDAKKDPNRFAVYVSDPDVPAFALDAEGRARIARAATVDGELTVHGAAAFEPVEDEDGAWRIHRAQQSGDADELRIQIGDPGRLVIGTWRDDAFQPCLTVDADGTVTVHGNLVVTGQIVANAAAAARLTDEARQFMGAGLLSGIGGASPLITGVFDGPFTPEPEIN